MLVQSTGKRAILNHRWMYNSTNMTRVRQSRCILLAGKFISFVARRTEAFHFVLDAIINEAPYRTWLTLSVTQNLLTRRYDDTAQREEPLLSISIHQPNCIRHSENNGKLFSLHRWWAGSTSFKISKRASGSSHSSLRLFLRLGS